MGRSSGAKNKRKHPKQHPKQQHNPKRKRPVDPVEDEQQLDFDEEDGGQQQRHHHDDDDAASHSDSNAVLDVRSRNRNRNRSIRNPSPSPSPDDDHSDAGSNHDAAEPDLHSMPEDNKDSHRILQVSYVERGWTAAANAEAASGGGECGSGSSSSRSTDNNSKRARRGSRNDTSSSNNKNDLIRRLRRVVDVLQKDQTLDPQDPAQGELPHLLDLSQLLCQPKYLEDREKEVRLTSLVACLEILGIYAPDSPFDEEQLIYIFQKVVAQVGNLAHAVDPATNANYRQYYRILELLAHVRMGVVLVELGRVLASDVQLSEDPIQLLARLFRTLLHMLQNDHPTHIHEMVQISIIACLEEYHVHVPVPLLDEILLCLAPGPTVWAINPAAHQPPKRSPVRPPSTSAAAAAAAGANHNTNKSTKTAAAAAAAAAPPRLKEPLQIEQPNPSYHVASKILRTTENHLSVSVSQLLNGLLNGELHVTAKSSIDSSLRSTKSGSAAAAADSDKPLPSSSLGMMLPPSSPAASAASLASSSHPWSTLANIIYELHRVAPRFLTSVVGTVSNGLVSHDESHRGTVVDLLGRVFAARHMTVHFRACYREWLERSQDVSVPIRRAMVKHLCKILPHPAGEAVDDANRALIGMLGDPALEVRQLAIYEVTDAIYRKNLSPATAGMAVSPELLGAVASRISSKFSEERRYAITGLAQVYYRHYVQDRLQPIQDSSRHAAGSDSDLSVVLSTLRRNCHHLGAGKLHASGNKRRRLGDVPDAPGTDPDVYRIIPRKILEAVCVDDSLDPETRSRVVQVVDEVLLGSELSSKSHKRLTTTARAVGLVLILDSLVDSGDEDDRRHHESGWFREGSNAFKYVQHLFGQRSALQASLRQYLDARAAARELEPGSTAFLVADANARELLEVAAKLTAPPRAPTTRGGNVLALFHGAKDKHVFRLLATLVDPLQTPKTRARALADLPRRVAPFGEAVSTWVKTLTRRCNMGDFMNGDVLGECVRLARDAFEEGDIPACSVLLSASKIAIDVFPVLGTQGETFRALQALTCSCGSARSGEAKEEINEMGLVTILSSVLKTVSSKADLLRTDDDEELASDEFLKQLLQLSSREGTPEQASHAAYALVRLSKRTESDSAAHPSGVKSLVKALTSPSRLTIDELKIASTIRSLSALTALADCVPHVFLATDAGRRAVEFALESVLVGRGESEDDGADDGRRFEEGEGSHATATPRKRRSTALSSSSSKRGKHRTPRASSSLLEDESLSHSCRRLCAAVEFLVSLVRSSRLRVKADPSLAIPTELVQRLIDTLTQILRDGGLPPSSRDRRTCRSRQDRAALRQCCGVHVLRLFDGRLGLDSKYLTPHVSHFLGGIFLDDERVVRVSVVKELIQLLEGGGVFGIEGSGEKPQSPPLRCLAYLALCTDGDHGADHDASNGSAANIGKLAAAVSKSAMDCVENLRRVCDGVYRNLRAQETNVEKAAALFDQMYKPLFLPEYVVPFVLHLLAHRSETPASDAVAEAPSNTAADDAADESLDSPHSVDRESQLRILRKRLKLVFEALVRSLGDDADNISFLLRITETIEKQYRPVDAILPTSAHSSSINSDGPSKRSVLLESKLQVVCRVAREVLLSLIKKDVNLTSYPGKIRIPPIFRKASQGRAAAGHPSKPAREHGSVDETNSSIGSRDIASDRLLPTPSSRQLDFPGESFQFADPTSARKVHFSPDIEVKLSAQQRVLAGDDGKEVSPIAKSRSPAPPHGSLGNEDARELSQVTIPSLDGLKSITSSQSDTKVSSVSALSAPASASKRRASVKANGRPQRSSKFKSDAVPPLVVDAPVPKQIKVRSSKSGGGDNNNRPPCPDPVAKGGAAVKTTKGLDELDFDFGSSSAVAATAVENDPPRRRNAKAGGGGGRGSSSSRAGAAHAKPAPRKAKGTTSAATAARKVVIDKAASASRLKVRR